MSSYPHLFSPFRIRHVQLKNRLVKSSQWTLYAEPDGSIGERIKTHYATIARGGVGLIIVEESICDYPLGASNVPHIRLDEDRFIPGLAELAAAIHAEGCPAFVQITHAGPAHNPAVSGMQPVAPSRLDPPAEPVFAVARELTVPEIRELVEKYAQAALRVKKAGFDGCEIHLAHYALGNAFLSRIQNKRTDEYGCQSLETRARFALEIIHRTRELVGDDFVVGVRLSCKEWGHELGTTVEEAIAFAKMFEAAGIDYIQASAYGYGPFSLCALPDLVLYPEVPPEVKPFAERIPDGALIPEAALVKQAVSIPVSGVGRLDWKTGERILAEGKVDLIWMGRRLFADPELPRKLQEGREEDIRPCLGCSQCLDIMLKNQPVECRVNPLLGHEREWKVEPAPTKKKVVVVGGGPGGLEAARVAALRGHQVELYDKAKELGGLLPMAAFIKGKEVDDLTELIAYYERQLRKLGVRVHLNANVTPDLIERLQPDAVVLAVGGQPVTPAIPGMESHKKVVTTEQLKARAKEFLRFLGAGALGHLTKVFLPVGKRVVVVGSDLAGLEAAEFLAKRDREVTVVDEAPQMGRGVLIHWLVRLLPWMAAKGIQVYNGVKYEGLSDEGLIITTAEGERKTLPADTIMVVNQYVRNEALYNALKGKVRELYLVGDATGEGRYILGAIHDGFHAARAL